MSVVRFLDDQHLRLHVSKNLDKLKEFGTGLFGVNREVLGKITCNDRASMPIVALMLNPTIAGIYKMSKSTQK